MSDPKTLRFDGEKFKKVEDLLKYLKAYSNHKIELIKKMNYILETFEVNPNKAFNETLSLIGLRRIRDGQSQ